MHLFKLTPATLLLAGLFLACGSQPELDVQVSDQKDQGREESAESAHLAEIPSDASSQLPEDHPPTTLPEGHPPLDQAMGINPPPPGAGAGEAALHWDTPKSWVEEQPANAMRRAQYRVPGPGGDAQCAVFYFGPGQGGDPEANAQRWAQQFTQPDGGSSIDALKTERIDVHGIPVLLVRVSGTFQASPMMGGSGKPERGWALLGAVVEGPDANWFFKLTGPQSTVTEADDGFMTMVRSVRQGTDPGQTA
jgi:hypothetical protein